MKPTKFTVDGKDFEAATMPPGVKVILDRIKQLKFGELLSTTALTHDLGQKISYLREHATQPGLMAYRHKIALKLYWGTAETINALREQLCPKNETKNEPQSPKSAQNKVP